MSDISFSISLSSMSQNVVTKTTFGKINIKLVQAVKPWPRFETNLCRTKDYIDELIVNVFGLSCKMRILYSTSA